jgi:hypothetical protein
MGLVFDRQKRAKKYRELVMLKTISVQKIRFEIMSLGGINLVFIAESNALISNPVARPTRP